MDEKNNCFYCGKELEYLPYICRYCGKSFCSEHRLPERHECEGLEKWKSGELKKFKKSIRIIETNKPFMEPYDLTVKPRDKFNTKIIWVILISAAIFIFYYLYSSGFFNELKSLRVDVFTTTTTIQKPEIDIPKLEKDVYELVNKKREIYGLKPLKWNDDIANVAKNHSQYLADLNQDFTLNFYINHLDQNGEYHDSRLNKAGIYYFKFSAENIGAGAIFSSYYPETNQPARYHTYEEMVTNTVEGWMNSPGHRKNILTPELDETGVGIATDITKTNYIFTQVFIQRTDCGYKDGSCCPSPPGYLPACYIPYNCISGVCR